MKNPRLRKYLSQKNNKKNAPITSKAELKNNPDKHITQDFENFRGTEATEAQIKPKTATEKKTAAVDVKDGEKKLESKKTRSKDEEDNGSGGAFDATETVKE